MTHQSPSPLHISRSILNQSPLNNTLQRTKQPSPSPHPYLLTNKRHDSPLRSSVNNYDLNPHTPTLPNIPDRVSPRGRASPFNALSKVIATNIALPVINNGNSTPKSTFSKSPENRPKEDSASSYRLYNLPSLKIDNGRTTPLKQNYPVSSRNIQFRSPGIQDPSPISSRTPRAKKFIFEMSKNTEISGTAGNSSQVEPNSGSRIENSRNTRENNKKPRLLKRQETETNRSPFDDDLLKEDQDAEYESLMSKARKYNMMNFYPSPKNQNQEKDKDSAFENLYNKISPRVNGNNVVLRANKSPTRGTEQGVGLPGLQVAATRSEENKEAKNKFGFGQGNKSPMRLNELLVDRIQSDPVARGGNATPLSGRLQEPKRVNKTRFYRKATEEQNSVKDAKDDEDDSLHVSVLEIDNEEEQVKVEKPRKKSPNLIFQRNDKRSNTTIKDRVQKVDSKEEVVKPESDIADDNKNMQILFMRSIIDDVNLKEYMWVDRKKSSKDGSSKISTDDSANATQMQKNPRKQKQELRRQVKNEQKKMNETFTCEVSKILDKESNDSNPTIKSKETPRATPQMKPMGQAYQDFFGLLADLDALDSLSATMQKTASQQKV